METRDRIAAIKRILSNSDRFKACPHCQFDYYDLGQGDDCPNCKLDIRLTSEDLQTLDLLESEDCGQDINLSEEDAYFLEISGD